MAVLGMAQENLFFRNIRYLVSCLFTYNAYYRMQFLITLDHDNRYSNCKTDHYLCAICETGDAGTGASQFWNTVCAKFCDLAYYRFEPPHILLIRIGK